MGLNIGDICSLVTKGYKVEDLKELNTLLSDKDDKTQSNIIEMSKKLPLNDLKTALSFIAETGKDQQQNKNDNPDDKNSGNNDDKSNDDKSKTDDVDYKKLYEDEKKLREQLQQSNQNRGAVNKDDDKTDEQLVLEIATDILN